MSESPDKGGKMQKNVKRINLNDRESIAIGIVRGQPLKRIAGLIGHHVSAVSNEVRKHRLFVRGSYYAGNDCRYAKGCDKRHICGDSGCYMYCHTCPKDCHNFCREYITNKCRKYEKPPYVCNACENRRYCNDDKYFYDARVANKQAVICRSESRKGIHLTDEQLSDINTLLSSNIKKGQPMAHIFAVHENEIPITSRTAYTYINDGLLDIRNIDLRRQAGYRKRRKKKESGILDQSFRKGRTYEDFIAYMKDKSDSKVVEMDTVKGRRDCGKTMLTMIFRRNSVMLIMLMPNCKAESVQYWFNFLENSLGKEVFHRLFEICLTDNGSEFKKVNDLELSEDNTLRTSIYYCDPMQSGQKGRLEKNHEYIRYVIPKGKSLATYTQDDMTVLMNHINSTKRPGLNNRSPYELVSDKDEDMRLLMKVLGLHSIPADEVNLKPGLLTH